MGSDRSPPHEADRHIDRRDVLRASAGLGAATFTGLPIGSAAGLAGPTADGAARGLPDPPAADDLGVTYQYFHATWSEIEADVPRLADLGVDAVWIQQPAIGKLDFDDQAYDGEDGFYEGQRSSYGWRDPHPPLGYQPVDLRNFDSSMGTEAELESLIATCHDHGIAVVVDVVLNHMSNIPAPEDPWGGEIDWPQFEVEPHFTHVPHFGYRDGIEDPQFDESLLDLPNLDVRSADVANAHRDYIQKIADLGADGIRYDAAAHVWPWYWEGEINPLAADLGLWRVGEVWDEGNVDALLEFADTGMTVFDFPLYAAIADAFEHGSMETLSQDAARGVAHREPDVAVTFAQNHDATGPGVGEDVPEGRAVELAEAFVLAYAGNPVLYRSDPENRHELDDGDLRDLVRVSQQFAEGDVIDRHVDYHVYVFERDGNLLAGINKGDAAETVTVETTWSDTVLTDQTGNGADVAVDGSGAVTIEVPAEGYVMYTDADDPGPGPDAPEVAFGSNEYAVETGETVDVDVTVSAGDEALDDDVTLTVDGTHAASEHVSIDAESSVAVTFDVDAGDLDAGEYDLEVAISADSDAATLVVDDGGEDGVTLRIEAPTAADESVYFTGSTDELTNWGGGVEGTPVDGRWEVTIDDPGDFEWKTRRGPAGASGDVWEAGSNHTDADLTPGHQGWEDGFEGGDGDELEGTYAIRAVHSGKALDVAGISHDSGANVHQWAYVGGDNQHWAIEHVDGDEYRLVAQHSGHALAVENAGAANGDDVVQEGWNGGDHQRWYVREVGEAYRIENVNSGRALDVAGISHDNGANVHQWEDVGGDNQRWTLHDL